MLLSSFKVFLEKKHRPFVVGTFFGALAITSSLIWSSYKSYLSEIEQAKTDVKNISQIVEQHVRGLFRSGDIILQETIYDIEAKGQKFKWSTDKYTDLLAPKLNYLPIVQGIKVYNVKGEYIGTENGKWPANTTIADRGYFQAQKANPKLGLVISPPVKSKTTGDWIIVLSRRTISTSQDFNGIAIVTLPLKSFSDFNQNLKIGENGTISLFSADKYTLLNRRPFDESMIGKEFASLPIFDQVKKSNLPTGLITSAANLDGIERIYNYSVIPELNLIVVAGLASKDVLKDWKRDTTTSFAILIVSFLSFGLFLKRYLNSLEEIEKNKVQMARSAKMSSLGEMSSGVAHEINNPLAIIDSRSNQLGRMLSEEKFDRTKAVRAANDIKSMTARIAMIIRGLRTFARNGEADPMQNTSLAEIVDPSLSLCIERFKNNGVDLKLTPTPKIYLFCRPTQISQVVLNLLNNAFDAIVTSPNPWVSLDFKTDNNKVSIIITDSGNGIPKEIEEKIMEPFFTTKAVGKGTGLGLSISKGIIEDHKGRISINKESANTQFIIELPIATSKVSTGNDNNSDLNADVNSENSKIKKPA